MERNKKIRNQEGVFSQGRNSVISQKQRRKTVQSGNPEILQEGEGDLIHICLLSCFYLCPCRRREHSPSTCLLGQRHQTWSNLPHPQHQTCSRAVKAALAVSLAKAASPAHLEEALVGVCLSKSFYNSSHSIVQTDFFVFFVCLFCCFFA